jgi:hypothetical protein
MFKTAVAALFLFFLVSVVIGQQQQPPSTPPPSAPPPSQPPPQLPPSQIPVPQGTPLINRNSRLADLIRPRSLLQPDPNAEVDPMAVRQMMIQKYAQPLYRRPTDKELLKISPDPLLFSAYVDFLKRPNAGVVRLVVDRKCDSDTAVLNASEACLEYTMPGAGNSYSFRTEYYRLRRLSDITYSDGKFEASGVFMHGIITDLGDVPIENLTTSSEGVSYLGQFQPSTDGKTALAVDERLKKGIWFEGRLYGHTSEVKPNHTYALRSIAYRGKVMRAVKGASYNELDFDKRRDVIVAFRVVAMEPDGSVTIVWNELQNMESPKLKVDQEEKASHP